MCLNKFYLKSVYIRVDRVCLFVVGEWGDNTLHMDGYAKIFYGMNEWRLR